MHFLDDRTADELYYLVPPQLRFGTRGRTEDGDEVAGLRLTCALVISPGWNTTAAACSSINSQFAHICDTVDLYMGFDNAMLRYPASMS